MVLRQTREEQEYSNGFQNGTRQSKLLFVDLAGSERAKYTKVISYSIIGSFQAMKFTRKTLERSSKVDSIKKFLFCMIQRKVHLMYILQS